MKEQAVTLTHNAIKRITHVAQREGRGAVVLRISIEGGGCQGFSYHFAFEDAPAQDDRVFDYGEARLVIDEVSLPLMQGAVVDFIEDLMGARFHIENPQASSSCGCGTSFSIEE